MLTSKFTLICIISLLSTSVPANAMHSRKSSPNLTESGSRNEKKPVDQKLEVLLITPEKPTSKEIREQLAAGADPNVVSCKEHPDMTIAQFAAQVCGKFDVAMIKYGARINFQDLGFKNTLLPHPLLRAIITGDLNGVRGYGIYNRSDETIREIFQENVDTISDQDILDELCAYAAGQGQLTIMLYFLELGANPQTALSTIAQILEHHKVTNDEHNQFVTAQQALRQNVIETARNTVQQVPTTAQEMLAYFGFTGITVALFLLLMTTSDL